MSIPAEKNARCDGNMNQVGF